MEADANSYSYLGPEFWREYNLVSGNVHNRIELPVLTSIEGFEKCALSVSSVNFRNAIQILKHEDYITIDNTRYRVFRRSITNLNPSSFSALLNDLIEYSDVSVLPNEAGVIRFFSTKPFTINDMSYNMRQLTGIDKLPVSASQAEYSSTFSVIAPRYGDYNSTPVFYLLSNMGVNSNGSGMLIQENGVMNGRNIFMRFANNHAPNFPVSYIGGDVKYHCPTSVLSQRGWIELVDANLVPVDLLYPLRISIRVEFVS